MSATPIPKVLIVNDDFHSAVAFKSVLAEGVERGEYEIVMAYSGEEALRYILKQEFAVVLLDVKMPIMDGFETAEAIHSNPRLASLPIIFVTAYYDDDFHRLQGYQKGAVDYIFMPVNPTVLQTKVSVFVEMARQKQELETRNEELHTISDRLRIRRLYDLSRNINLLADEAGSMGGANNAADASSATQTVVMKDSLTGLPNRALLVEHLEHAVGYSFRYHECFALLAVEIDEPDQVDAQSVKSVADALLIRVADSIRLEVRISDLIARIGENRFAVLLKGINGFQEAAHVAGKIATGISQVYRIEDMNMEVDLNIGLALYPNDGMSPEELIHAAEAALYPGRQFVLH